MRNNPNLWKRARKLYATARVTKGVWLLSMLCTGVTKFNLSSPLLGMYLYFHAGAEYLPKNFIHSDNSDKTSCIVSHA